MKEGIMNVLDVHGVLGKLSKESGKSNYRLSKDIDRSPSFVSTSIASGTVPQLDTVVKIADAAGVDIFLRLKDGEEIKIVCDED